MFYIKLILVVGIISTGIIGGYYQLLLYQNLKEKNASSVLFSSWIFDSDKLNDKGKYYRKKMFLFWSVAIILIIAMQIINNI